MGDSVASEMARRSGALGAAADARSPTPGELAWLAVWPCVAVVLVLALLLGPPLGHALLAPRGDAFWPSVEAVQPIRPEPVEHARYLIVLLGVVALCGAVLVRPRAPRLTPKAAGALVAASQGAVALALLAFLAAQQVHTYGDIYGGPFRRAYFSPVTLAVATATTAALVVALRRRSAAARGASWLRETRVKRVAFAVFAVVVTLLWLLTAVFLDSSIGHSDFPINVTLPFSIDEAYAVLDGRTPLVNFHAQYGQLWPYIAALSMSAFGASVTTFTITMACGTALGLLSVYALLRRVVRSSLGAFVLYLPFVATGFFMARGPAATRYGPSNLFTIFPIRYVGPYLLAWLTARHVDRARPHAVPALFCAAGLVALNNPEFGIAAVGASFAALLAARAPLSARAVARLAGGALLGMLGALALLSLLTLLRAGSLPHLGLLLEFARIDGVEGWTLLPMPPVGFHLVVLVTFAAALVLATVRVVTRAEDTLLTAMLAWSGIFGMGAGSYYVARSHPEVLIDLFSAWALAVVLLLVAAVRAIRARAGHRPTLPELAVLFSFSLCVCSLGQFPTPWSQIHRLRDAGIEDNSVYVRFEDADRLVARFTHPGERVLIFLPVSHRVAWENGVTNVLPWVSIESMPLASQLDDALDALREAGGRKLFLWRRTTWREVIAVLPQRGFVRTRWEERGWRLEEWVRRGPDRR